MSDVIEIKPIGYIKTPFPSKFGIPRQSGILNSIEGIIVFEREFRDINAFRELEKSLISGLSGAFPIMTENRGHHLSDPQN